MKIKSLFMLFIVISFMFACDLLKNEEVKILDANLITSTKSGMDLENASMAKQLGEAKVQGTVQNVSEKKLKNVIITYKIGRESVTAKVGALEPNQKKKFTTTGHRTNQRTPKFSLESITFKE